MLFVSAERSHQEEVTNLFKKLYDGKKKMYPNGSIMLFIPHNTLSNASIVFKTKILFNHNKYIGDETLLSIGGLQDLNSIVKLKNGKFVTLQIILKSIPASEGMSCPQLFQHVKLNHGATVTIVTYQAQSHQLAIAHQATLENEIRQIIEPEEEKNIFLNDSKGLWFGGVHKSKTGRIFLHNNADKADHDYTSHINRIMNSPPKK